MEAKESVEITEINSLTTLNEYLSTKDNSENISYISGIPKACKDYPCVLGIDEAGRGPVLGPMVYGTAFCPINEVNLLVSMECADSKVLKEENRDEIFTKILESNKSVGWAVEIISPNKICNHMLSRSKYSLNQISMDAAVGLINAAVDNGVNVSQIYVDTVGKPDKYQAYLKNIFPNYDITVSIKADSKYSVVSAASICAKVVRDHSLQVWKFPEGLDITNKDFGSGYPSDPITKKFLVNYCDHVFGYPQLVRFSWSTATNALDSNAFNIQCEEIEETPVPTNNTSITSFFKIDKKKSIKKTKHSFFTDRHLSNTNEF